MSRKLRVVPATAGALAFGCAVMFTPLLSSATARTAPGIATSAASRVTALWRSHAGYAPPHLARTGRRPEIVGGYDAAPGNFGFMAFVVYFDDAGNPVFSCSGTTVAPNAVLTAGHCGVDENTGAPLDPSGYVVATGALDVSTVTQDQLSGVSRVVLDPAYEPGVLDSSDAALLILSTPTTAPAIPLATGADQYLDLGGTGAEIAGWGATYYGDPTLQTYLQWAPTVVQRSAYCSQFDPDFLSSTELCAINPPDYDTGTCVGDSGGPIVAAGPTGQPIEIGITSHGPIDCNTYTADYFTNVIPIASWAAGWITAVAPPPPPAPAPAPSAPAPAQPSQPAPLPTLTFADAKLDVRQTLAGVLGPRFRPPHQYTAKCSRESSTRITCVIRFWHGPNDYYGNVTIYYVTGQYGDAVWTDDYTIRWVSDQCHFHSGHPKRCAIHTRHGAW